MDNYNDCWYHSNDGLRLYARDYHCHDSDNPDPPTILCMHGLTRNSADFAGLADHLYERFRVIAVDQRGRGRSEYDGDAGNYNPQVYVQDMFTLLDHLKVARVTLIGTSMGGLMSFLMAAMQPERIKAMIINDIGPEVDPGGLARIKGYVGKSAQVTNWDEAVAQCRAINESAFPDFSDEQWRDFARGMFCEEDGIPVLAYDPAIAQSLDEERVDVAPPDLWPVFERCASKPMLLIRGADSDILAPACVARMRDCHDALQVAEIPRRGHAPTLTERTSLVAIDAFLSGR